MAVAPRITTPGMAYSITTLGPVIKTLGLALWSLVITLRVCKISSIACKNLSLITIIVYNLASRAIDGAYSSRNAYFQVPRTVTSLFTRRTELLSRIQTVLCSDTSSTKKQKRFVVTGLGGQGKSEICLQVADLLKDEYLHFKKLFTVY
jgi:hypothetical protein